MCDLSLANVEVKISFGLVERGMAFSYAETAYRSSTRTVSHDAFASAERHFGHARSFLLEGDASALYRLLVPRFLGDVGKES